MNRSRNFVDAPVAVERNYKDTLFRMSLTEAVELAVEECIREGILSDFLQKNRAEAIAVSIFEYDEEKELALFREAERTEGFEQGLEQGLRALINSLKKFCPDVDMLYSNVIANSDYANLTREEFNKYL